MHTAVLTCLSCERKQVTLDQLELHHVHVEPVTYFGRTAIQVTDAAHHMDDAGRFAVLPGTSLQGKMIYKSSHVFALVILFTLSATLNAQEPQKPALLRNN